MSSKTPKLSGSKLIKILEKLGFEVIRIKGSHHFLRHADERCTTVPVHRNEIIGPGLLNKILDDCEISKDKLKKLI